MIAVVDYGAGNLFSVAHALGRLGAECAVTKDPGEIRRAERILLPGVGAFPDAMARLNEMGLTDVLREEAPRKPFLGICLGMQLLFETGEEYEETPGLGLIPGRVRLIDAKGLKIPHIGWNELHMTAPCPLLDGLAEGTHVYFVHSYMAETDPWYVAATADYGEEVTAMVQNGCIWGAQFHPEKSGEAGLRILENFLKAGRA